MNANENLENAWGELRHILRRFSDVYGINYNTMFTAVRDTITKVIEENK